MKVAIIGGGIVGLATGYRMLERYPAVELLLLEKEDGPGQHQSGNNSGVLHCGLYYTPGSAKARLAVTGIRRMVEFCQQHAIPHELCGKIVVATQDEEIPRLRALLERGTANGLKGLKWLQTAQIREIEPHAAGIEAIYVPEEGIVDYAAVCRAMLAELRTRGGEVKFCSEVTGLANGARWVIHSRSGDHEADFIINCAGLHSDRVSRMTGNHNTTKIVPFRGEYYKLKPEREHLVRHLIYPVPDPKFPFLGVHFTRLIRGGVECGPNAVLALKREGYRKTDFSLRDTLESLTYPGFWRFFLRYPSMCCEELKRSFSKELFCQALQKLIPEVRPQDLEPSGAGVRAQAMSNDGKLLQDFCFVPRPGALNVLNAPSPGATASLAIADEILEAAGEVFSR